MLEKEDLHLAINHSLKSLRRAVRNLRKFQPSETVEYPAELIDHPVVYLRDELVRDAKVFANRLTMLRNIGALENGVCCEIGTSTGAFAKEISAALRPSKLHIIDIDYSRFDPSLRTRNIETHEGDSVRVLNSFPDKIFDFVYVDADHSYKSVKAEIAVIKKKIKSGGIVMFNDYTRWSITEVQPYGVQSAVNELMNELDLKMVGIALSGTGHYDVAVRFP